MHTSYISLKTISFKTNGKKWAGIIVMSAVLAAGLLTIGACASAPAAQPAPTANRTQQTSPATATPTKPASGAATPAASSKPAQQPTAAGSPGKPAGEASGATATSVPSSSTQKTTPAANASAAQASTSLPVPTNRLQKNQAGNVTIEVTWEANQAAKDSLRFAVVMDTHSVDLDKYDMAKLTTLRTDKGRQVVPTAWDGPPGGGHHRTGAIVFPAAEGGKSLIETDTKYVEVTIRDVANIKERVLRWNLEKN
ncbi:MAG: hypothetical protein HYY30_11220 [Chloroflexi bacterium]|nr:hypothetical protein [Chloroflexota bacterium]